jgi:hypothetical protein
VAYDLAPLGIPDEASVHAGILAARIGDSLAFVTLQTGATSVYADPDWILRSLTLSPDGSRAAATVEKRPEPGLVDLYLFHVP